MAYYTSKIRKDRAVYHVCKSCTVGNNIEKEYLVVGVPTGARLCEVCRELQLKRRCAPGVPTPAR